jgi:large subunit ribosomal protein L5e
MAFTKVQLTKAYYKRLQVKYRRRRQGKTDYQARRNMVKQAKDKYNTPKYRLVVRITNKKFICQVVYSTIQGDRTICQATSKELENYDVPIGHTNYAAGYATGLLIARRTLQKMGIDKDFVGVEEPDAEEYHIEETDTERRPFKVILDVGSIRTIQGSRIFGVLKGAVDGGLHVPHSINKFPGYVGPDERGAEHQYDTSVHLDRILGRHVSEYMEMLNEEDQERYKAQFSKFLENDLEAESLEEMYQNAHKAIREDPVFKKAECKGITHKIEGNYTTPSEGEKYERKRRLAKSQRVARVGQKIAAARKKMLEAMDDDEEEEE